MLNCRDKILNQAAAVQCSAVRKNKYLTSLISLHSYCFNVECNQQSLSDRYYNLKEDC